MKSLLLGTFLAIAIFASGNAFAAQASFRTFCMSLKFAQGSDSFGFSTVDFSTLPSSVNGELAPYDLEYGWNSGLIMYNDLYEETYYGEIKMSVPELDANGDGFFDIFDFNLACNASTSGEIAFPAIGMGPYSISVSWNRSAGSKSGVCSWTSPYGNFSQSFEIIDYRGVLSYVKGTPARGTVSLVRSGDPSATLGGPLQFTPDHVMPQEVLDIGSGVWTNQSFQPLQFFPAYVEHDPVLKTNYYGLLEFHDGDLSTVEDDYYYWMVSIDDTSDADGDGVPDFSDVDPAPATALLALSKSPQGLSLSVTAPIGSSWKVQSASTLSGPWTDGSLVSITSSPQSVTLPAPSGTTFWRLIKSGS